MSVTPTFLNGLLFFGGQGDDKLYGVDAGTGKLVWELAGIKDMYESQPLVAGGVVYVHGASEYYAVDAKSGNVLWTLESAGAGSPSAMGNNAIYTTVTNRMLVALDPKIGKVIWQRADIQVPSNTSIVYDATRQSIYVAVSETKIASLSASDGSTLWQFALPVVSGKPAEARFALADRILYVRVWQNTKGNGALYALNADSGERLWDFDTGSEGVYVPSIANGFVYFCGWLSRTVYALNATNGQKNWSYSLAGRGGNTAVSDGRLYVASQDGIIYAFGNK